MKITSVKVKGALDPNGDSWKAREQFEQIIGATPPMPPIFEPINQQKIQDDMRAIDQVDEGEVWYDERRDEFYIQIGNDLYTRRIADHGGHTDDVGNRYVLVVKKGFASLASAVFEEVGVL